MNFQSSSLPLPWLNKNTCFNSPGLKSLTCIVLEALAGVPPLSAPARAVSSAGLRIAEVDLCLAVVSSEASRTAAAQPGDGMDGSEQDGVRRDERRQAVELQHRHTLHVVLARLAEADVVVKREDFLGGDFSQQAAVQVQPLLELLRPKEIPACTLRPSPGPVAPVAEPSGLLMGLGEHGHGHREADVEDAGADVCVVLDVKDDHVLARG